MGQEIDHCHFSNHDFNNFSRRLKEETRILGELFENNAFSQRGLIGGFEIEAWLISPSGHPAPVNNKLLTELNNPLVVHELAAFNVELNSEPVELTGNAFSNMLEQLQKTWEHCRIEANALSIEMMMIGILPSIKQKDLSMVNMSKLNRYRALNEQVIKLRKGQPLKLDIEGEESIQTSQQDVMFESACTSLQLHLQVPIKQAISFYNTSIMLSAPLVAATANSPYLLGQSLWHETRIPLFEQSVELGDENYRRVTFGNNYIEHSLFECFEENLMHYPVLVPLTEDSAPEKLDCVRFHNGTIWRWNRPLLGFDHDGTPHIRIEQRVIPSGPTIIDSIANAAFYFALASAFAENISDLQIQLPFEQARENFYQCARHGLDANITWPEKNTISIKQLLLEEMLPAAHRGFAKLKIEQQDADRFLTIIEQRITSEQNGANWQRLWIERHGRDMNRLTQAYLEQQNTGQPVHEWKI